METGPKPQNERTGDSPAPEYIIAENLVEGEKGILTEIKNELASILEGRDIDGLLACGYIRTQAGDNQNADTINETEPRTSFYALRLAEYSEAIENDPEQTPYKRTLPHSEARRNKDRYHVIIAIYDPEKVNETDEPYRYEPKEGVGLNEAEIARFVIAKRYPIG